MPSQSYVDPVRRPISLKIFGIAVGLLMLMIVVTLSSSIYILRMGRQTAVLADFYIKPDQIWRARTNLQAGTATQAGSMLPEFPAAPLHCIPSRLNAPAKKILNRFLHVLTNIGPLVSTSTSRMR